MTRIFGDTLLITAALLAISAATARSDTGHDTPVLGPCIALSPEEWASGIGGLRQAPGRVYANTTPIWPTPVVPLLPIIPGGGGSHVVVEPEPSPVSLPASIWMGVAGVAVFVAAGWAAGRKRG